MADFDINQVKGNDRYIAGGAIILLIDSFLSWYTYSFKGPVAALTATGHDSGSLWHQPYGFLKLALILSLVAGALVIARLMGSLDNVNLPAGINIITLALSGLATFIFLLRFLTAFKSNSILGASISAHPAFGWYIGLLVSGAMTYFAFLNFKASGEALPTRPGSTPPPPES